MPLCAAVVYLGHRLDSLSPTDPGVLVAVGAFLRLLVGGRVLSRARAQARAHRRIGSAACCAACCFLASSIVFLDTVFFAAIVPLLPTYAADFDLSKTGAGILAAAYPAGTFLGRAARRLAGRAASACARPSCVGLATLIASSLAFAFANSIVVLDIARFVQGLGGAASWAGAVGWLVGAAPRERRGELIGSAMARGDRRRARRPGARRRRGGARPGDRVQRVALAAVGPARVGAAARPRSRRRAAADDADGARRAGRAADRRRDVADRASSG